MNFASNLPKLYAFAALKMALFPMAIITLYWKDHIGLSLSQILLLQALFSIATVLLEYPSGYLSDRLGYRFALNLASVLGIAGWGWYTMADCFADVLGAELLLGSSFAFVSGADSALLFESLRSEGREEEYTRYDGRMTGCAQAGEAAGALFAGALYAAAPLLPFVIQVGVWVTALLICRRLKETPAHRISPPGSHLAEAWRICRTALGSNRQMRYAILLAAILGLSSFIPVWLIQPYMQQAGVPLVWFGPIWAAANLTVALFSLLSHRFRFRLGEIGLAGLFLLLVVGGYLGLGLTHGLFGFAFYFLLTAMRGLQGPHLRHHLQRGGSRSNRASILSLKSLVFRLMFVVCGPLIGRMADVYGLHFTFLTLTAVLGIAAGLLTILFLRQLPDRG